jgi:hypothetical protein
VFESRDVISEQGQRVRNSVFARYLAPGVSDSAKRDVGEGLCDLAR